ncbi:3-oxoacyl-[acyl-carrier-protein] reductase [Candidatus Liberibacter africanus]|uniref:3-oxoacyl-[acyl-carrier-protein] reductase n=1 Tax=Candidatus Liberibacter africanus PTSAPSY TaxID=1277257 RepID=A0A0G3I397_LIBAF|nr:3-oxoacyl-[acyl-carrier-protein] reductase [Candidatus Liberibacter africanus]AKK20366.1 3-ketoacyl-(acyl-carrier-protein) reductase [Candidatus Liberibacter africanus PTSAPSY]QTP64106.1 3-oxoacyl-[acyl-carrier-protein] reductase [Candidatus Liberibacter africanus]
MFDLTGKKALVTGASGSIGLAIAKILYQRGASVGLHGTSHEKLQGVAHHFDDTNRFFLFPSNFSDRSSVEDLSTNVAEEMGGVDILVNNAGIVRDALLMRARDEDWDNVLFVNLTSVFLLTRRLIPAMIKKRFGRIINITSVVGFVGNAGQANYCAAKSGLTGFTKALAKETGKRKVTVNCVSPGFIASNMTANLTEEQHQNIISSIPMQCMGNVNDVASAVLYLSSEEASYVTGQTIHVNGGMAMI